MREGAPPSQATDRWIRWVIRFRWFVFASWLAIFVLSQLAIRDLPNLWRSEAGLPGTDAQQVEDVLQRDFAAIPATIALVWAFAHAMGMEQMVLNLVTFIGLGIAIDYSLLIVYRYREELHRGGSKEDAVVRTMQTASRAVVSSGTAVAS